MYQSHLIFFDILMLHESYISYNNISFKTQNNPFFNELCFHLSALASVLLILTKLKNSTLKIVINEVV